MTESSYRPLRPRESVDVLSSDETALRDVIHQSLNIPAKAWPSILTNVGRENLRALWRDNRIVAGCGIYPMGQWFGGKVVPTAGVTLVGVAPDLRGEGAAKELMTGALREAHLQGTPLASLYASSQRVYRSVGFEQAGHRVLYEFELNHIGRCEKQLNLHPVSLDDAASFQSLYEWRCLRTSGLLKRSAGLWNRILNYHIDPEIPQYGYLIGDRKRPEGYVILRHECIHGVEYKLIIRDYVVQSQAAAETLWSFVASHRSVASSVIWSGPANDPLLCLPDESRYIKVADWHRWMLRIVDVPKALAARGYPQHVKAELHLDVRDDIIPGNARRFVLSVEAGAATIEPGGNGELSLDIKGLAPLYTGMMTAAELQNIGWIDGDDLALHKADTIFQGPQPWIVEMF